MSLWNRIAPRSRRIRKLCAAEDPAKTTFQVVEGWPTIRLGWANRSDARRRAHCLDDIVGGHADMLHAGAAVKLQILLDLGLALAFRRFVAGKLDPLVAVGH